MKKIFSFFVITLFVNIVSSQTTMIPDTNFEQELINQGLDIGVIDGIVSTASIDTVTYLNVSNKSISDLTGIQDFTALTYFDCTSNQLTNIDLTQNTALTHLYCYLNQLTSLDLTQNTALISVRCSDNQLTSLDITQNTVLNHLSCSANQLTSLDVTQNIALTVLYCFYNQLTSLDVTQNTALVRFKCFNNQLSSINMSQNTSLEHFSCYNNQLTGLDMTQNTVLRAFITNNNQLVYLNLQNGSNNLIDTLNTFTNPDLSCIQVDNISYSSSNWTPSSSPIYVGPNSTFSLDCSGYLVDMINVQGYLGATTIATQGGTLQMEAEVLPTYADNSTYNWSVTNGTGSATINSSGQLTAVTDGTIIVTATANDASGVTGTAVITISNQSLGINERINNNDLSIFPNPAKHQLNIVTEEVIYSVEIYNIFGEIIQTETITNFSIENLPKGTYLLKIRTNTDIIIKRFIKN